MLLAAVDLLQKDRWFYRTDVLAVERQWATDLPLPIWFSRRCEALSIADARQAAAPSPSDGG